ncbi:MAG: tetratricopeptide repeat protein, partial [Pseudoxanthomonas sp.]
TTLAYNTLYHLGLVHYLQGDYQKALDTYNQLLKISDNDDSVVAVTDWMWMSLMRMDRKKEAAALLEKITPDMEILENDSYHRRLLMYKGVETPQALLDTEGADSTAVATQGYGVGNFYLVNGDTAKAKQVFEMITTTPGWNAFGYIAAENDLQRMK